MKVQGPSMSWRVETRYWMKPAADLTELES